VEIFYIGISLDKKGINPILASIAALASFIFQIKKVKKMHSECVITHPLSMEGDCSLNNTKIGFHQILSKMIIMAIGLIMIHILILMT